MSAPGDGTRARTRLRVLVTGATSGIGLAAARARAGEPRVELLLHGRDPERLETALASLAGARAARPLTADLLDRAAVAGLAARAAPVDVLVSNAGAVFPADASRTADGHEPTWQLNHLAPFELTALLAPSRVVAVASAAHRRARIAWEDPDVLHGWPAYKQSKLANVLFTHTLARRGATHAVSLDPGVVDTRFAHALPEGDPLRRRLLGQHRGDPAVPGATLARLATGALDAPSGAYVGATGGRGRVDPAARDDESAERLWTLSERALALA